MKHTRSTPYPGTQAVQRAVSLLKAVSAVRPERGLTELARAVGLNKTTAYRLLTALEREGLVERSPEGDGYRPGPELVALGSRALGSADLRFAARGELDALAQATRETVTLEVLVGRDALILDEAAGSHVIVSMPSIGTHWPAHATSTGKVLLAFLPDADRASRTAAPLARLTGKTIAEPSALGRELARIRERGYATSAEELEPGFVAVAAPICGADGRVVAALSVGGPKARLTAERVAEIARLLPASVARVAQRLGYREDNRPALLAPAPGGEARR
jgi:IclR family transcriptional regulator, acetate operon repressor